MISISEIMRMDDLESAIIIDEEEIIIKSLEFSKLFSKEMRTRNFAISECYATGIVFHHKLKHRNDKFILRYEGGYARDEWEVNNFSDEDYFFTIPSPRL